MSLTTRWWYYIGMQVSRQADPRANQKKRTRAAIIEAAAALLREGTLPTVADAAERALVSRATAYRYFPTQESLLLDVAQVEPLVAPVEALVASFSTDDVAQRLTDLIDTFMPILLGEEVIVRTAVRVYLDTWLENRRSGQETPVRAGRRARWLEEALRPIQTQLGDAGWRRLRSVLSLTLGTEAVIAMRDVAGLEDNEEIVADLRWAARALLQAALAGAAASA
jgi:AcrR family transcriptional regulator